MRVSGPCSMWRAITICECDVNNGTVLVRVQSFSKKRQTRPRARETKKQHRIAIFSPPLSLPFPSPSPPSLYGAAEEGEVVYAGMCKPSEGRRSQPEPTGASRRHCGPLIVGRGWGEVRTLTRRPVWPRTGSRRWPLG